MEDYTNKVRQFTDLTEITSVGEYAIDVNKIVTEFAFAVTAPYTSSEGLRESGFKPISAMNNWWPSHAGEQRKLTFYWQHFPKNKNLEEKIPVRRQYWQYGSADLTFRRIEKHLASGGCGFKIGEPPLLKKYFFQFFTLLRMPVVVSKRDLELLNQWNYSYVDTGSVASYWINGWAPSKYTFEKEYRFFNTTQKEWSLNGQSWDGSRWEK